VIVLSDLARIEPHLGRWVAGLGGALVLDFAAGLPAGLTFARASGQMVRAANGVATWLSDNVYPLHHDVSGAPLGVLLERESASVAPDSVSLKSSSGVTVTTGAGVAPDGANSAVLIREDSASSLHRGWYNDTPCFVDDRNVVSVFVKPNGRVWSRLYVGSDYQSFHAVTGPGAEGNALDSWTESWSDGWVRLSVRISRATAANLAPQIRMATGDATMSYLGDGASGQYLWGYDYLNAAYPTSHIPAAPGPVTRARTSLSGTFAARVPRTIRISGAAPLGVQPAADQFLCALTGDGGGSLIEVYRDYTNRHVIVRYGSTAIDLGAVPDGATFDLGGATMLPGAPQVDTIYVGSDALGGRDWDSTIKEVILT